MENTEYKKTKLINFPKVITVGDLEAALLQNDKTAKKVLLKVIFHRLHNRYIRPINNIKPTERRSGFLMMAIACLMVEAYQSFLEKHEYTRKKGAGKKCFRNFFKGNNAFSELAPFYHGFYANIRCGVLHQAETYENWLITREEGTPLFDSQKKSINADVFLAELAKSFLTYSRYLAKADLNDPLWKAAKFKLEKICEHCRPNQNIQVGAGQNSSLVKLGLRFCQQIWRKWLAAVGWK